MLVDFGQYSNQKLNATCKLEETFLPNTSYAIAGTIFLCLVFGGVWSSKSEQLKKQFFRKFYLFIFFVSAIWVIMWTQKDVNEMSNYFLGKKTLENSVFGGSRFLALGWGSMEKIFSRAKSIHLNTRERLKKSNNFTFLPKRHLYFRMLWSTFSKNRTYALSLLVEQWNLAIWVL